MSSPIDPQVEDIACAPITDEKIIKSKYDVLDGMSLVHYLPVCDQ
jgi:hypothetical protein